MRTNGFALFIGSGREREAERAAARTKRHCSEVATATVSVKGDRTATIVGYTLDEDRSLPVVHGFLDRRAGEEEGEFSALLRAGGGIVAKRDPLGTRPLYVGPDGSSLATDHRLLGEDPKLVPVGAVVDVGSMKVGRSGLTETPPVRAGLDECAAKVAGLLVASVERRTRGRRKVAVSFSGGLDSSLIALIAARKTEVVLCSAFTAGSRDESYAESAAESLGLELVAKEVDDGAVARELREMDLPFVVTPMDKALWCIYSTSSRLAAESGAELIMLGQLADELFGGYMKYSRAAAEDKKAAVEMMRLDVIESGQRAFVRDEEACARFTEVRFPFADPALASFALGLPLEYKVAGGERKVVLRRAATLLGLPDALAGAPKKAAQYSSGVAKLVSARLA
jgi:asparagine synthase (glutamine-hydrolysing)